MKPFLCIKGDIDFDVTEESFKMYAETSNGGYFEW